MKSKFVLIVIILSCNIQLTCKAQEIDKRLLLNKINSSVLALKEGQFNIHNVSSREAVADSLRSDQISSCFFKLLPSDSLLGYQLSVNMKHSEYYKEIYDGCNLWTVYNQTLVNTDKVKHPEKINKFKSNCLFYPIFKFINNQIQLYNQDTMINKLKIIGIQSYKGEPCYKIQNADARGRIDTKVEKYWYISVKSNIPLGTLVKFETTIGQVKSTLTIENWMSEFKEETLPPNQFTKEKLSGYTKEIQYEPGYINNGLLPIGSIAPDWELPLISGDKMKLSNLKGKVVVMDFWFKACAPCQEQMISLQKLHDKYDKDKVIFIGVNTIDDLTKDQLQLFLEKRNISMLSVYNGKTIEKLYNAPYSPALFIIDKEGKVAYVLDGVSDNLLSDVSTVIERIL